MPLSDRPAEHRASLSEPVRLPPFRARSIVLIGGGRWGRVHAGVLQALLPADGNITWVSRHNQSELLRWLTRHEEAGPQMSLTSNLKQALESKPDAAVVVTAPLIHGALTRELLEAGVPTLVEKPLALDAGEVELLIDLAERQRLLLGVGLHFLFATYLKHFHALWRDRQVRSAILTWSDPETELRYGEIKRVNPSTPIAHDIYPHLWAILRVLFPRAAPQILRVYRTPFGRLCVEMLVGDRAITADICRRAQERERRIDLRFAGGGTAVLDFTTEPGKVILDERHYDSDPNWGKTARPLTAEVASFLSALDDPTLAANWPCRAANVRGSVAGAVELAAKQFDSDATALANGLASGRNLVTDPDLRGLILDNLAPELARAGWRFESDQLQGLLLEGAVAALGLSRGVSGSASEAYAAARRSPFLELVKKRLRPRSSGGH